MAAQAAPNRKAKTTICSTSLRAMASMMLAGNVCSTCWPAWSALSAAAASAARARDRHALAGTHQIDHAEPEEQRERGDDFEIEDRLRADAAHVLEVAAARDAGTSVPNSSGAMIERISRRKIVLMQPELLAPHPGAKTPSATPAAMPMKIQAVSEIRFIVLPI